jgi:hypothetical protein
MSGIPEAIVRSWVGHVDDEVIRTYTSDEESQRAMARLAEARSVPEPQAKEGENVPSSEESKISTVSAQQREAKIAASRKLKAVAGLERRLPA